MRKTGGKAEEIKKKFDRKMRSINIDCLLSSSRWMERIREFFAFFPSLFLLFAQQARK